MLKQPKRVIVGEGVSQQVIGAEQRQLRRKLGKAHDALSYLSVVTRVEGGRFFRRIEAGGLRSKCHCLPIRAWGCSGDA